MTHVPAVLPRSLAIGALVAAQVAVACTGSVPKPERRPAASVADYYVGRERRDDPAGAAAYWLQRRLDEHGRYDPNNVLKAIRHKQGMASSLDVWGDSGAWLANGGLNRMNWEDLGPGNVGGRIRSIVIHPDDPSVMYLGAVSGGVWKTTVGGAAWFPVDDFMANLGVSTLAMDPDNPAILYAGTGEVFRGAGIFKSTDDGFSWNQLPATASSSNFWFVNRVAVSPGDSQLLLAATNAGIFRSTNGGDSWSTAAELALSSSTVVFHPEQGSQALSGSRSACKVHHTTDGGDTWTEATGIPTGGGSCRVELAYARSSPDIVYAIVDRNNGELYRSTNGGLSFTLTSSQNGLLGQGWYNAVIWVDPTDPEAVIVGGVKLARSTNAGATWSWPGEIGPNPIHDDHHVIVEHPHYATDPTKRLLFLGNDGGIYRSDETVSNRAILNNNLRITQFYAAVPHPENGFIVGGAQDNGSQCYHGNQDAWREVGGGDGAFAAAHPLLDPDGTAYFYVNRERMNPPDRVTLGPQCTLLGSAPVATFPFDGSLFIAPMALDPNDPSRLYKGGSRLWRMMNPRTSIEAPATDIKAAVTGSAPISAIAVTPGNSDIIWVGHNTGQLFATTNGTAAAPTWVRKDPPPFLNRSINSIAIDPFNSNRVYVGLAGFGGANVWKTEDGGATWSDTSGALPHVPAWAVSIYPHRSDRVYVGTETGVFGSDDGGATWSPSNEGPANAVVEGLFWMQGRLVAVTHGRSMLRIQIDTPPTASITGPADGSHFQPGVPVAVTAQAADDNGTIARVQLYDGSTLVAEDVTAPYSFSLPSPSAGAHKLTVRATDNDGNVTVSRPVVIRDLPAPWLHADVGAVGVAGTAYFAPATFTVAGSGTDIWGAADGMHFVYRPLSGNGQIIARVGSVQNTNAFAKAGVMIRETLDPGARNAFAGVTATSGFTFQTRTSPGGTTTSNRTTGFAAPYWAKLVRNGNSFTAFRSPDGVTWTQQGAAVTVTMTAVVYVGLAVTSHANTVLNTSTLTDVNFTAGNPSALLVVGNTTLNSGDTALRNRLQVLGYTVVVKSGVAAISDDALGKALVLISATVNPTDVADKFLWSRAPVICSEPLLFDDMRLTGSVVGTNLGTVAGQTQGTIVFPAHPLAGGLSGTSALATVAGPFGFGAPGPNAVRVVTVPGDPDKALVFAFDAVMQTGVPGGTTVSRRVGFFLSDTTAASLTTQGRTLLDAAIGWAAGTL